MFALWCALVLQAALAHVVWRDEVRALSLALQGDNVVAMLRAIHGEGHPALWYLLLRATHAITGRPEVLQACAFLVAAAALFLMVRHAPFSVPVMILVLMSRFATFEFAVMARNYGISMLVMFLFAHCYERHRHSGILLGVLLFLLANCNAHSIILVGGFELLWLTDALTAPRAERLPALKTWALNGTIAALGILACALTVYPTAQDLVMTTGPAHASPAALIADILLPARSFNEITLRGPRAVLDALHLWQPAWEDAANLLMSLLLFGITFGLVRRPGALIAALAALLGMSMFFQVIYPGEYRHAALWLVFLISLYWIVRSGPARPQGALPATGWVLFLLFLALNAPLGLAEFAVARNPDRPYSRSRDLADLVHATPDLHDATIIADPDYLLEALPYYLPNRLYLLREQRDGAVVSFTSKARLRLSLDDILADAARLRAETAHPVLILLQTPLDPAGPGLHVRESYQWDLEATQAEVRRFLAATTLVKHLGPARTDETYDVYRYE